MNELGRRGLREIGEVADALRISFADEDDEGRLIDDAAMRQSVPVGRDRAALSQPLRVALDGEDRDVGADALKNLVRDRLGAGEGGSEANFLPPCSCFHLAAKPGKIAFSIASFIIEKP